MQTVGQAWMWAAFFVIVLAMLAIDLVLVGGGHRHRVRAREALGWTAVWVSVAMAFAAALWWQLEATQGQAVADQKVLEYLTGYFIEKSLAVDNLFVWLMLFNFFGIPLDLQKRVLGYGVLGAIVLRAGMIFGGIWLITRFDWLLYVFGAFLLFTGFKMWWAAEQAPDLAHNRLVHWLKRHMRLTHELHGERFFVLQQGARHATPLLLALVLVELSDIVFAVDSIPAIFAITTDPFIVLTSNVFALLGLRAMYFLLADMADRFALLKYGLALVLVFVGTKMLIVDFVHVPPLLSLGVVASIITVSVLLSLAATRRKRLPRTRPPV